MHYMCQQHKPLDGVEGEEGGSLIQLGYVCQQHNPVDDVEGEEGCGVEHPEGAVQPLRCQLAAGQQLGLGRLGMIGKSSRVT